MIFTIATGAYFKIHGITPIAVRQFVRELTDIGIGGINVKCFDPEIEPSRANSTNLIIDCAQQADLRICTHAPAVDISATDPSTRTRAVASVQRAIANLGSYIAGLVITVHPENYAPQRQPGDENARMDSCHRSLKSLAGTAGGLGAHLALENMRWRPDAPNRTGMTVDQLSEIIQGLSSETVGICFDTGHANISEMDRLPNVFRRNASRIIHIHYQDNIGGEDLHLPPGQGNINFRPLLDTVNQCGYKGMVELEVPIPIDVDPLSFYKRNYQYFREMIKLMP